MAADLIVYCLSELTDYSQFERFGCDLMVKCGWVEIEPLGGSRDGGRDALHKGNKDEGAVVFAFSAREDWEKKLREDLLRIEELKHPCTKVVFVSNRGMTTEQRDKCIETTKAEFGFELEIYDVERIRVNLLDRAQSLLALHPGIFPPDFFPRSRDARGEEPIPPVQNEQLAAFELGFSSENLEYRVSLVAWMAGPKAHPDFQQPLDFLVPRLSNSAHVVLGAAEASRIDEALRMLTEQAHSPDASAVRVVSAARRAQAELSASRVLLTTDLQKTAFSLGQLVGTWDRTATETRTADIEQLRPRLETLGMSEIAPSIELMLARFRDRKSVMDVHVLSELAGVIRMRMGSPPASATNADPPSASWSEVERFLRDPIKRFRKDGRALWNQLQASGHVAPAAILKTAEDAILRLEDSEASSTLELLRRENGAEVTEIWKRMIGPLTRGELGQETSGGVAYKVAEHAEALGLLLKTMNESEALVDPLLSDLLSAVFSCVATGGAVLRANLDEIQRVCSKYERHHFVTKIRREL